MFCDFEKENKRCSDGGRWRVCAGGDTRLQDLAAVGGAVDVLAGLVHAQGDAVQQDHHDADTLEPRGGRPVKEEACFSHCSLRATPTPETINPSAHLLIIIPPAGLCSDYTFYINTGLNQACYHTLCKSLSSPPPPQKNSPSTENRQVSV